MGQNRAKMTQKHLFFLIFDEKRHIGTKISHKTLFRRDRGQNVPIVGGGYYRHRTLI